MLRIIDSEEKRVGRFSWGRGYNVIIWSTCDFCDKIVHRKSNKIFGNCFIYTESYTDADPFDPPTEEELNEKHFCSNSCKEEWEELYNAKTN